MKKMLDLRVTGNIQLNRTYFLLKLTPADGGKLPPMQPGQFVEVLVEDSPKTFLRRPISINFVDESINELWLLVQAIGEGTRHLSRRAEGDVINLICPLGNGFTLPEATATTCLLIGGGVGTAPLLYLGCRLRQLGVTPVFLLGARTQADLTQLDMFEKFGEVHCTTEDGSAGEKGYVTNHSILRDMFSMIYTCGPKPMMQAVAKFAKSVNTACEVSLENMMGCGIGTCLCCVEKTCDGNVCVCTEGPVFNIERLVWTV